MKTSRERPQPAQYLRLKKGKVFEISKGGTSLGSSLLQNFGPFGALNIFLIKMKFEQSHGAENWKGALWSF